MSHMLDLTAFNPNLFGGSQDEEDKQSRAASNSRSGIGEGDVERRTTGNSSKLFDKCDVLRTLSPLHNSVSHGEPSTTNFSKSKLTNVTSVASSDSDTAKVSTKFSYKALSGSEESNSENGAYDNPIENDDDPFKSASESDEGEDESDDSLSKFLQKQRAEQKYSHGHSSVLNSDSRGDNRHRISNQNSMGNSVSTAKFQARKRNTSDDLREVIEEDPELYGIRRSGRSRKEPERLNISLEDASESDSDRPLSNRRQRSQNRSRSVRGGLSNRNSGSKIKQYRRQYESNDENEDDDSDSESDEPGRVNSNDYSSSEDSEGYNKRTSVPKKTNKKKLKRSNQNNSKFLKRSTRSAQGGISYKEASSDSEEDRKRKNAAANRASAVAIAYGAARSVRAGPGIAPYSRLIRRPSSPSSRLRVAKSEDTDNSVDSDDESEFRATGKAASRQLSMTDNHDPFGESETEGIERVLNYRIGRIGATGDKTTIYNVSENGDPNLGFGAGGSSVSADDGEIQFYIKWRSWSHLHNTWESLESLEAKNVDGMKKIHNFRTTVEEVRQWKRKASPEELEIYDYNEELNDEILREHATVERVISQTKATNADGYVDYLCKFKGLPYGECTWEDGGLIEKMFPNAVSEYYVRQRSQHIPSKSCRVLKIRPKFIPYLEQPSYMGSTVLVKSEHLKNDGSALESDDDNDDDDEDDVSLNRKKALEANALKLAGKPTLKKPAEPLKLRDYQLAGINWLAHSWTRGNSVILADEMGLGKTIQTIGFLNYLFYEHNCYGPNLLVVPLSTVMGWKHEMERWAPSLNAIYYLGDAESRKFIRQFEWAHPNKRLKFNILVTTYEILLKDKAFLSPLTWTVLAVDEAHRLKNDDSLLYKALIEFETNTRLLITGTPLQNSLRELWALLHFIMPHKFESWSDFEEHHGSASAKSTGFSSLHRQLEPYLLRRIKKDVERSLPNKTEQILRVEMSRLQKQYYKWILTRNYKALTKGVKGSCSSFINIVMELKKCCNHPFLVRAQEDHEVARNRDERLTQLVKSSGKLMLLDKLLIRLKDTGHRVLIFSQMVRMLDMLAEYLTLRGWSFQRLDGTVRGDQRKVAMDHFNAEQSVDFCFLLSTRAGGLGVNLATADTVIIFDSDWNPQNDLQAQARAHRIGQTRQVSVYRLVHKNSVEEDILERAKKKMVLDHLVIQRMDTTGRTVLNKSLGQEGSNKNSNPFNKDELSQILKFGAQELFGEADGDEEEPEVDVDDILRMAETRQVEEEEHSSAASDLLSQFKVVTFDNLEDEEIVIRNEGRQRKGVNSAAAVSRDSAALSNSGGAQVDDSTTWDDIIPEDTRKRLEQEEAEQRLMELELGPRQRRTVQPLNYGCDDREKEEVSDEDSSSSDGGGATRRGRGRGQAGRNATNDPRTRGFTDKEIRALIRALRKFAVPLERLEDVAAEAELQEKSSSDLRALIETIVNGCQEALITASSGGGGADHEESCASETTATTKRKTPYFQLGRVSVPVKAILQVSHDLAPLHKALSALKRDDLRNFKISFHTKPAAWDCVWDEVDDSALLVGIWEHGLDNWDAIKEDPDLGLRSKIMREGFLKPQATHLKTRVEYLLKFMVHKGSDTHAGSKSVRVKKSTNHRKDAVSSSAGNSLLVPKSKEFISSDSSDSSDEAVGFDGKSASNCGASASSSSKKSAASRGIKRTAAAENSVDVKRKRSNTSKVPASSGQGDGEATRKPVHLTAEKHNESAPDKITCGNENDDNVAETDKLDSAVFNECKEKLRPVRKALKKLQETASNDLDAMSDHLLKIGDHISSLIRASASKDEQRVWRNYLWIFVSYFTESDKTQLHKLYKRTYKKREEETRGSSKRRRETSDSIDEHSNNRHHHHGTSIKAKHKEHRKDSSEPSHKNCENLDRWSSKKSLSDRKLQEDQQQHRNFGSSHVHGNSKRHEPTSSSTKHNSSANQNASTYLEYQRQVHGGEWRNNERGDRSSGSNFRSSVCSTAAPTTNRYNNSYNRRGGATSWTSSNRTYSNNQFASNGSNSGSKYGGSRGGGAAGY